MIMTPHHKTTIYLHTLPLVILMINHFQANGPSLGVSDLLKDPHFLSSPRHLVSENGQNHLKAVQQFGALEAMTVQRTSTHINRKTKTISLTDGTESPAFLLHSGPAIQSTPHLYKAQVLQGLVGKHSTTHQEIENLAEMRHCSIQSVNGDQIQCANSSFSIQDTELTHLLLIKDIGSKAYDVLVYPCLYHKATNTCLDIISNYFLIGTDIKKDPIVSQLLSAIAGPLFFAYFPVVQLK